ncbi:glutamate receptor-interacting protein 1 [Schistocerca nitens]|uniref:glutamate receptor-interacting protein 1 n=1 Tax=Schistocerca nitens TaxID=7011 RepID=UPI002118B448|nr:glutamate receptor-interacting protein 1 [Schistocerca nitens]
MMKLWRMFRKPQTAGAGGVEPVLCGGMNNGTAEIGSVEEVDIDYSRGGEERPVQKTVQVVLERDAETGSLGVTLRGGRAGEPPVCRPLLVTTVRPGGPADREGSLCPGDRLVAVDGQSVRGASLCEAHALLVAGGAAVSLLIEYDVARVRELHCASGPLRVELRHAAGAGRSLGLALADRGRAVVVSAVRPASLADRCGALHVGDRILAVADTRIEGSSMTAAEVSNLLHGNTIVLEILPVSRIGCGDWYNKTGTPEARTALVPTISPCSSSFSTLDFRHQSKQYSRARRQQNEASNHESGSVTSAGCTGVCHSETVYLTLQSDLHGYGIAVQGTSAGEVVVSGIDKDSPADRCGCIQIGDRLLFVNGRMVDQEHLPAEAVTQILQDACEGSLLSLQLEFDVADSVVPSSGVFSIKLAKRGNGLGITITASKNRLPGDSLLISDIRRGSVAHRTGTLQPGDHLLAIDGVSLEHYTLEETQNILKNSADIVTLRIKKSDCVKDIADIKSVVYTVELVRHGGPLGITIAGSEEPLDPITISALSAGGLAQQTGALHVGDRLLAINGQSLQGKPLSEGIALLQSSGDTVTLKVERSITQSPLIEIQAEGLIHGRQFCSALPSVDSAVASWESSIRGNTPPQTAHDDYCGESSSVKRKHRSTVIHNSTSHWDGTSQSSHSIDSGQSGALSEEEEKLLYSKNLKAEPEQSIHYLMNSSNDELCTPVDPTLSGRETVFSCVGSPLRTTLHRPQDSPLPLPHYLCGNENLVESSNLKNECGLSDSLWHDSPQLVEIYQVTLIKDPVYEDFGFSVSDGLYERGVYINRMRKRGPADLCGVLKPYDRILQVNNTQTNDFDCCLTVPLIASAGEKLELTVARAVSTPQTENKVLQWAQQDAEAMKSLETITKTL